VPVLRDYAIVLGWGEHYKEAIAAIRQVFSLEKEQPDWALREFARSYLFGDDPEAALRLLDELVARGDTSEPVLVRHGLALRWLNRPQEARAAYEAAVKIHPNSGALRAGIVYSLGAEDKLSDALRAADAGLAAVPGDPELLKAKIRILNWKGRHLEAQQVLNTLPTGMSKDREVLEDRVYAARWGGDPRGAVQNSELLKAAFPTSSTAKSLSDQLSLDYGFAAMPGLRYISDSDGFIDRTWSGEFDMHLSPSQELHAGYVYRQFLQTESLAWQRYELGWTGVLSHRVQAYATLADVEYQEHGSPQRIVGDGGLSFAVNDTVKLSAGGGSIAMDAFASVKNHVTAPFEFGNVVLTPSHLTRFDIRYTHFQFSDGVTRNRADFEGTHRFYARQAFKLNFGFRSNLMQHDHQTQDFYSPSSFQSHLLLAQVFGRIARPLDYWVEVGGGWQKEPATPLEHPFQVSGKLIWHMAEKFRAVLELGRTTAALERVNPYRQPYSRQYASIGLEFRFR
jgi:tetratricopeptide (TPR) repeat protein